MADYILKNRHRLIELVQKADLSEVPGLSEVSSTEELRNKISKTSKSDWYFERLCKFFILQHIYDYAGKRIISYESAIKKALQELLGANPAHESIEIEKRSGLNFPFKIWTKRTVIILSTAVIIWIILLGYLYINFPDLWFFTFHLPISGIFILMLPVVVLTMISRRVFVQEKFENISSLEELVNETYHKNEEKIKSDGFAYLNEQLKDYINK